MIPIAKPIIGEKEKSMVIEVLDSGIIASGSYVRKFEEKFSRYCNVREGIATTSGTSALCVALKSLGINSGDHVLTTPFSFIATGNSILYCNAKPVFADIDENTFNIDPDKIEEKLREDDKINTLLIVHLYGLPCNMSKIMKIVKEYQIYLVEDCAQAHGAEFRGKRVGSFGNISCFSFYPTKNMTTGEGGMILTNDKEIAEKCRLYINHGMSERYKHETVGFNYRMTNIQAVIGLCQLEKLDKLNSKRIENASFLSENLSELEWLLIPIVPRGYKHVFNQYTIKVSDRNSFVRYLSKNEIGYGIYYPKTICNQPLYRKLNLYERFSVAERIAKMVVSLPVHPSLSTNDLDYICGKIKEFER
ncbi:MAG: aminotransferase DegT [Candidatus Altiarchaeales archaeon]|nr:MAG: aminotransferase DegT [Candidatus Altiarchaeales archaeon]